MLAPGRLWLDGHNLSVDSSVGICALWCVVHRVWDLGDVSFCDQGIVPFDNLADSVEKCGDILGEMELDDVIQGERILILA